MAFKEKQNIVGATSQKLGERIAIYGKIFVASGIDNGDITIYERDDDGLWVELKTIAKSPNFGSSLDLHREVLASGDNTSKVVYAYSSSDDFVSEISLTSSDSSTSFGSSVSISDDCIAIGSPDRDTNKGAVYIYEKVGDTWLSSTEDYIVTPNDADTSQFFGTTVAINDDFLIVGAKGDNESRGAVYVFKKNEETGIFEQSQKIIASDGQSGDEFGGTVSMSDNYFAVGAEFADTSDTEINTGAVYIFSYSNIWNQLRKITSVDESGLIANQFGHSIDLQGDYLIVGSPNAGNRGVADVFYKKRNWGHLKKITSDQTQSDLFGNSVAIDYPSLVVGASGFIDTTDEGKVYIFEDPEVRLRLAQEFDADFQPSKASVYLKRSGENTSSSWLLTDSKPSIMDASNFSSIDGPTDIVSLSPISQWKMNDNGDSFVVDSQGLEDGRLIYWKQSPWAFTPQNTSSSSILHTYPLSSMDRFFSLPAIQTGSPVIDQSVFILVNGNDAYTFSDGSKDESFSMSLWVRLSDRTKAGTFVSRTFRSAGVNFWGWKFYQSNGRVLVQLFSQDSADYIGFVTDSQELEDDQWCFLSFTYNSDTASFELYKDGDIVSITDISSGTYIAMSNSSTTITIGGELTSEPAAQLDVRIPLNGFIDNVCIFDKVLTQSEVDFLYQEGSGTEALSGNSNQLIFDDEATGFTGNGYIMNKEENSPTADYGLVNYPIRNSVPNNYNVWIRCSSGSGDISGSSVFTADVLLDGIVVKEINEVVTDGEWSWVSTSLVLPDTQQHILGIRMKEKDSAIDKIYIDADADFTPEGSGPPYIESPYVTIHMKVYESDGSIPVNPLQVYDYKTTLDEIIQDDWYNFDISFTDKIVDEYGESFFLVMSSSGANADNFTAWEVISSDEYSSLNAGLRLTEVALDFNEINTSLTKRLYYQAKAGDADIDVDTWYLDSTQTHAFKIFSDFDPIEDV